MVYVLRELAGGGGIDAEVDPVRAQGLGDLGEHQVWPGLVMHRVERGDEVEPVDLAEMGGVALLEARVREAFAIGLGASRGDPTIGEVEADESRAGERLGHQVSGMTGSAPGV